MGNTSESIEKQNELLPPEKKQIKKCPHLDKVSNFCNSCQIFLCDECYSNPMHLNHSSLKYRIKISNYINEMDNFLLENELDFNNLLENLKEVHEKFEKNLDEAFEIVLEELKTQHLEFKRNYKENVFNKKFYEVVQNAPNYFMEFKNIKEILNSDEIVMDRNKVFEIIDRLQLEVKSFEINQLNKESKNVLRTIDCLNDFVKDEIKVDFDFYNNCFVKKIKNGWDNYFGFLSDKHLFVFDEINKLMEKQCKYKLLYKASTDCFSSETFHKKCDGKKPILIFVKTNYNRVFGGFANAAFSYSNEETYSQCEKEQAFIFSIDKHSIHPIFKDKTDKCINSFKGNGPVFGTNDFMLSNNCNKNYNSHTSSFGQTYKLPENIEAYSPFAWEYLNGSKNDRYFKVLDYEAWMCI